MAMNSISDTHRLCDTAIKYIDFDNNKNHINTHKQWTLSCGRMAHKYTMKKKNNKRTYTLHAHFRFFFFVKRNIQVHD